jgi:hypothetical protein
MIPILEHKLSASSIECVVRTMLRPSVEDLSGMRCDMSATRHARRYGGEIEPNMCLVQPIGHTSLQLDVQEYNNSKYFAYASHFVPARQSQPPKPSIPNPNLMKSQRKRRVDTSSPLEGSSRKRAMGRPDGITSFKWQQQQKEEAEAAHLSLSCKLIASSYCLQKAPSSCHTSNMFIPTAYCSSSIANVQLSLQSQQKHPRSHKDVSCPAQHAYMYAYLYIYMYAFYIYLPTF